MKNNEVKIYGSGGHSQVIRHVLEENGYTIAEVFDDHPEGVHRASINVVQGLRGKKKDSLKQDTPVVIAIGNNRQRAEISSLLKANYQTVIHNSAIVASNSEVGDGTVIFAGAIIQPNTVIGKHVIINTAASIDHDNIIGDYAHISPKAALTGHVEIGEGTHVGVGAVIIPTVKVGKWCTIGAGAVVLKDVPDYCTVVGNPGRIIKRQLPPVIHRNPEDSNFDMVFIGAGISSAFTLLKVLNKLTTEDRLRIGVMEKSGEFFTGIPYGKRSGHSTHLITALKDFLPEHELHPFVDWLNQNKEWLLKRLKEEGGMLTNEWLENHKDDFENGLWEELYIPRSFFGSYIQERLQQAIEREQRSGRITLDYITEEAIDIQLKEYGYLIKGKQRDVKSRKVILGIGSPQQKKLHLTGDNKNGQHLIINNPYEQGIDNVICQIFKSLNRNKDQKRNVLILGSNASALEFLYKMNDLKGVDSKIDKYFFLSTHGLSPDPMRNTDDERSFTPKHTIALQALDTLTAEQIAEAVTKDLNDAEELGIGAAITVEPVSKSFTALLEKLDQREKERFACYYGNEIGRRQRVAGYHYTKTIDHLKKQVRFKHLKGRFEKFQLTDQSKLIPVFCNEQGDKEIFDTPIDIVINCLGSSCLSDSEAPEIVKNLLSKGMAHINPSGRGLTVNQQLETANNLHIIGPLLAGNVIDQNPVWHVEHCGRIIAISELLSNTLITTPRRQPQSQPELIIHDLSRKEDIKNYRILLEAYDEHPYYRYEYFKHHKQDDNNILVAELRVNDKSMGIMPVLKRKIHHVDLPGYYDIITPYGYGGPLFQPEATPETKNSFWKLLEEWYREENIVSEFIRFNHNGNHIGYKGELMPTLKNVRGRILKNKEEQWKQFRSKVRNNYRKAEKHQLSFCSYSGEEITRDQIASFHSVYTETMDRNNAASHYFFKLEYFEDLIMGNPESFILAFALKDNEIASTELIIVHHNTMFAFLGGTRVKYFPYRPNDYLRVEIIEMARQKDISWYILGGGRSDNDGLYKSKKYLFPKDEDFVFYTGRKVINNEVYHALCEENIPKESNYFPKYRLKTLEEAPTT